MRSTPRHLLLRRSISLLALGVLSVSALLAGCGGDTSGGSADDTFDFGDSLPTHDQIVERAQKETGELQVAGSFNDTVTAELAEAFKAKYPFATAVVSDVSSDQGPTILLEMQSDRHEGDLIKIEENKWKDYEPFMANVDLEALSSNGSLDLGSPAMTDPGSKKLFAYATYLGATAWNPAVMAKYGVNMEDVKTHEDLLKVCEKLPPGQMATDASPEQVAPLGEVMGDDWLNQYAKDFFDKCKPAFTRGTGARLTGVASGEWAISNLNNYHSVLNQIAEGGSLEYKFLTPITGKTSGLTGIRAGTPRPYTSLLFLEFMASPEAQAILDVDGPVSSFIPNGGEYPAAEGTKNYEVVHGQETSIADWASLDEYVTRILKIQEIWGFPTGSK